LKVRPDGCALCGSTWGDVHRTVGGERLFFCCDLCAVQVEVVQDRILGATGWPALDELLFEGGRAGRTVRARSGDRRFVARIRWDVEGQLTFFHPVAEDAARPAGTRTEK
jgi:hypothetical protein